MNEFASISELMQSRKDEINSKDITEKKVIQFIWLINYDTNVETVCAVELLYF